MKRNEHDEFIEKKIRRTQKGTRSAINSREEKIIVSVILIALVIMGALLVKLAITPIETEQFSVIYYLDSGKKTDNIPKTVVLGENSTFSLWVGVENHEGKTRTYIVEVKIDDGNSPLNPSPLEATESFEKTLTNEERWEFPVTINIEQMGSNRVIFELSYFNGTNLVYTGNWVNLSIEAEETNSQININ